MRNQSTGCFLLHKNGGKVMGRKSRYSEYAKGMKKKADAKAQNFRMCLSEYLLQSGQIHKNGESEKQEWIFQRQPAE